MTKCNIQLPNSLKAFVDEQTAASGFSDSSAYVEHLIREDQKRKAKAALETELLKGLEGGPPTRANDAYWATKERKLAKPRRRNGAQ